LFFECEHIAITERKEKKKQEKKLPGLRRLRFYDHKSLKVKSFNINFTVLKADGVKASNELE